jgi:hypothetical protein
MMCNSKNLALLLLLRFYYLTSAQTVSPYRIVIDGGSTGSRLHVFEFVENEETLDVECVRRGSSRANVPLSAFGRDDDSHDASSSNNSTNHDEYLSPQEVAEHMLPLFEYAATVIPSIHHATTQVKYQATAGMRLLTPEGQEEVYDALYQGLIEAPTFVFESIQRHDIATLSGELEGFYGAVAANYLKGIIDANLHTKVPAKRPRQPVKEENHSIHHHGPIGALDMGGSSTQIVFSTKETEATMSCPAADSDNDVDQTCPVEPSRLDGDDFFATSYLSYGVDQFRERLWTTWVNDQQVYDDEKSCISKVLDNPCANTGYEIEWEGYTLVGTGEAHECVRQVQRLIPHHEKVYDRKDDALVNDGKESFVVGGVEHPPLQGKFFAMSLYFFTLDSLRELSHPSKEAHEALNLSWPTPSIDELHNALDGLCSRSWEGDLEEIQHEAHAFTRAEVLPHRCLESVYMVTLLRDGFGFHPESRDITFTFLVDGSEVEWSLGMALSLHAEEQQSLQQLKGVGIESDTSSTVTANSRDINMTSDEDEEECPSGDYHTASSSCCSGDDDESHHTSRTHSPVFS